MTETGIREKKRIALTSVIAALGLTSLKLLVGLETDSLGILSEAAHSGLDLLAAIITFIAVSVADRPPDKDHRYGHGKMENLSALAETLLLVVTCGWIIWEAINRLANKSSHVEATVWSFAVMIFAILIDIGRSRALYRVARKYNSQALEADALHFSSDVWSSLTVIGGLAFVWFGFKELDAISALVVSFIVLFVSYRLGQRTIDALMDRVPKGLGEVIDPIIRKTEGVEDIRLLRVRTSGAKIFVDATIAISRTVPFERAHYIMDEVEKAVQQHNPHIDVILHAEPIKLANESLEERIRMLVIHQGLPSPHNIEIVRTGGKHYFEFDVEYPHGKKFEEAHTISSEIEEAIRKEIPDAGKITIHMEEYFPTEIDHTDATQREQSLLRRIKEEALTDARVRACEDTTLLKHRNSYRLSLTCKIDSSKTLGEVHEIISDLERRLHQRFAQLKRIVIHAEPMKKV